MKFTGFSEKTSSFFWELAFNNEREWFLAHKQEFEDTVNTPFKALANDTMDIMASRYEALAMQLHISRIYRDARRLFGRGPYKDHLWFSIKSSKALLEGPMFWFEIGAKDISWGMGFYSATADQMAAYRRAIDANPARFRRIAEEIEEEPSFRVTGEEYSKPKKIWDEDDIISRWYNRKRLGVEVDNDFGPVAENAHLPELLCACYEKLMPLYEFFLEFYNAAPPEEKKRR